MFPTGIRLFCPKCKEYPDSVYIEQTGLRFHHQKCGEWLEERKKTALEVADEAIVEKWKEVAKGIDRPVAENFTKYDAGKPRFDLIPPEALLDIAKILEYGSRKYDDNNWMKSDSWAKYYAALQRHLNAWWNGEDNDQETGISHLAHAGCCLVFLQWYEKHKPQADDRMKYGK